MTGSVSGSVRRGPLDTARRAARDPARVLAELRRRALLRRDAAALRERLGPSWLVDPVPAGARPRVLFTPIGCWPWQVKLEGAFARALAERGAVPGFLVRRRAWVHARRYLGAFGVANPVFLDDYLDQVPESEVEEALAGVGEQPWSLARAQAFEHRGWPLGRSALSTAVVALRHEGLVIGARQVRERYLAELREAVRLALAADRIYLDIGPRTVWFGERNYLPWGALAEVAVERGLDVVHCTGAHRADAFILRRVTRGNRLAHPFSLGTRAWAQVRAMPWDEERGRAAVATLEENYRSGHWFRRKYATQGKVFLAPEEVRERLALRPGRKVACVFPHILWDGTFGYGRTLFGDYEAWLLRTLEAASANRHLDWLVKIHPDHVWKSRTAGEALRPAEMTAIERAFGGVPAHVRLIPPDTDVQTFSLYPVLDYGVTVRGTVGIELACFGVPVVTAGTGRYDHLGFTLDPPDEASYLELLASLHRRPRLSAAQTELARRHAWALFHLRPWVVTSVQNTYRPLEQAEHPLASDVVVQVRTPEELRRAPDMEALATWVMDSAEEDYLVPLATPSAEPPLAGAR